MFKKILIGVVLNGIALYVVTQLLSEIQYTGGFKFFIIGGLVIGILNTFVKPLMKLLSLPLIFVTAGLFSLVINVIIFWLTIRAVNAIHIADVTVTVSGVVSYIIAAFIFAATNWFLYLFIRNK